LRPLLITLNSNTPSAPDLPWSTLIRDVLRQLDIPHKGITLTRKKEGIETVLSRFNSDTSVLHEKLQSLVRSWGTQISPPNEILPGGESVSPATSLKTENNQAETLTSSATNSNELPRTYFG
jgi:diguanylate cyclase